MAHLFACWFFLSQQPNTRIFMVLLKIYSGSRLNVMKIVSAHVWCYVYKIKSTTTKNRLEPPNPTELCDVFMSGIAFWNAEFVPVCVVLLHKWLYVMLHAWLVHHLRADAENKAITTTSRDAESMHCAKQKVNTFGFQANLLQTLLIAHGGCNLTIFLNFQRIWSNITILTYNILAPEFTERVSILSSAIENRNYRDFRQMSWDCSPK